MNELHPSDERILAGIGRHLDGVEPLVPRPPAWQPRQAAAGGERRSFGVTSRAGLGLGGLVAAVLVVAVLALALGPLGQRNAPAASGSRSPDASDTLVGPTMTYRLELDRAAARGDLAGDTDRTAAILRQRLDEFGVKSQVRVDGPGLVTVTIQPAADSPELRGLFGVGALAFVDLPASQYGMQGERGAKPLPDAGEAIDPTLPAQFTGADFVRSKTQLRSDASGTWGVDFTFTPDATRRFATYTAANVNHYFAIVLDGKVLSVPYIKGPIDGGQGSITLGSSRSAIALAAIVKSGPLPVPVVVANAPGPTPGHVPTATPAPADALHWVGPANLGAPGPSDRVFGWSGGYLVTSDAQTANDSIRIWYSADGWQWGAPATFAVQSPSASVLVAARQGRVVALLARRDCEYGFGTCNPLGTSVETSRDGRSWTNAGDVAAFAGTTIRAITADDSRFLAFGSAGTSNRAWTSEDGTTWTEVSLPKGPVFNVTGLRSGFVAVGSAGAAANGHVTPAAWYSADGRSWSGGALPATSPREFAGALAFHVTGQTATIAFVGASSATDTAAWATRDGTTWRAVTSAHPFYCSDGIGAISFGAGPIVNGSATLTGWTSADGVDWTEVPFDGPSLPDDSLMAVPSSQGIQPSVACGPNGVVVLNGDKVWLATRS